jgi:SPP1 family predicted phage head-tail adaptor
MNLNGKTTNPGELRTPITLQTPSISTDAGGAQRPTYATLAVVKAKWVNAHGAEVWQSQAAQAVSPATVLIRYRGDVTTGCTILKGGQLYEIVSLDDIQERHEYLELKVKRVTGTV